MRGNLVFEELGEFSTEDERTLKSKLIKLLRTNGHNKFADRLNKFSLKIVALEDEPRTAAISFDTGTIFINEGFLSDPKTFKQLDVLMRHELAHNLMMHQIRMAHELEKKYGNEMGKSLSKSVSLHQLLNIIMDDEISNTRYTAEDKKTVQNMVLNGKVIGGLVTELHRPGWQNLTLEQMYEELTKEIDNINWIIRGDWQNQFDNADFIGKETIVSLYHYARAAEQFNDWQDAFVNGSTVQDFIDGNGAYHFACYDQGGAACVVRLQDLPKEWQDLVTAYYSALKEHFDTMTVNDLKQLAATISDTSPLESATLVNFNGEVVESNGKMLKVYSPEEKLLAVDILRGCREMVELEKLWYERTKEFFEQIAPMLTGKAIDKAILDDAIAELNKN